MHGLNASGRAPAAATLEEFQQRNLQQIPLRGPLSVSVPGVVDGWNELLTKHGTITLAQALEPAIRYARDGYAVSEIIVVAVARGARRAVERSRTRPRCSCRAASRPRPATSSRTRRLPTSLEQIAKGGRDAFYKGPIAKAIADDMQKRGGLLTAQDLAANHPDWVDPISTTYRGYEVLELPPNTQGVVALEMLNILEGFDLKALGHNTAAYLHLLVEAKRIAFADRDAWLGDPSATPPRPRSTKMLSKDYAAQRRKEISPDHARDHYSRSRSTARATPGLERTPVRRRATRST